MLERSQNFKYAHRHLIAQRTDLDNKCHLKNGLENKQLRN